MERTGLAASSPDNAGAGQYCQMVWARQARREGVTKVNQHLKATKEVHQLQSGRYGLGCDAHPQGKLPSWFMSLTGEAMMNFCGVVMAMSQGHSWTPNLSNGSRVNVGTILAAPSQLAASQLVGRLVAS